MIIPTGIGAAIGGHSGDATWAARLIGASCDQLILHPNVVNGSDLNEMPENSLYVEGSALDRFLHGDFNLRQVHSNRIAVMCNESNLDTVNAVNAAAVMRGIAAQVIILDTPLRMIGTVEDGVASGTIEGESELINQCMRLDVDAIAIHSPIEVERSVSEKYLEVGGINPWGGVEAKLTHAVGAALDIPVAHAPIETMNFWTGPTDFRLGPEMISRSHLFCVLKGLHRAPRISFANIRSGDVTLQDVDVLISPMCYGTPHKMCRDASIPVIYVQNNTTTFADHVTGYADDIDKLVPNYFEAAGRLRALACGIK